MNLTSHQTFALGAFWAALAVAIGAFGAHGLRHVVDAAQLPTFETGARYHAYAALALMAAGAVGLGGMPALLLLLGSLVFSFSLYALVLSGVGALGAITPIGGVLMMTGLVWLGVQAWQGLAGAGL